MPFRKIFPRKRIEKYVSLIPESGRKLEERLILTDLTAQGVQAVLAAGYGKEDFCSVIKVLEEQARFEVKARKKNTNFCCF